MEQLKVHSQILHDPVVHIYLVLLQINFFDMYLLFFKKKIQKNSHRAALHSEALAAPFLTRGDSYWRLVRGRPPTLCTVERGRAVRVRGDAILSRHADRFVFMFFLCVFLRKK